MSLQNSTKLYAHAIKHNYAIGAFNFVNLETLGAILKAASDEKSPVIVQCSTSAIKYAGINNLEALIKANNYSIPIILNLDHGKTFEDCVNAINHGFTNVMIDGSTLEFSENIKLTKKVVEYAHARGVTVEAELGILAGIEDEVNSHFSNYTNPMQAKQFVEQTGVDSLAIAIGTSHGLRKFKQTPNLKLDVLTKIEELLPNFPLVLHGASSIDSTMVEKLNKYGANVKNANGVPENMLVEVCTKHNIVKINMDSDLRIAFTLGVRETLFNLPETVDIRKYLDNGKSYVYNTVKNKIKNVFLSSNKANLI